MRDLPEELTLQAAHVADMSATTFYRVAALRQEVFVVEQDCVYLDLDGRDLEGGSVQIWAEEASGAIAATVRILVEEPGERGTRSIGRVVTAPTWRGHGVAAVLLEAAIERCAGRPIMLHAQSHLVDWYARFGFISCGAEYLEDGIPHTPMRLN
ncbi:MULTISPECIES: GNAT family N-acetyltransferase [Leucobacter]|uniref:GNAT family N-acetyltransferase n=2 Tax=Leucobacter TaxID=55968 RepID=A0ABN3B2P2_9MICO|nr:MULTISPECIES: GNAT family N-acetyltransferase [Leucobacter]MBS3182525.1 GNAT family N-acetyltransferase [Leucobacter manosquensis]